VQPASGVDLERFPHLVSDADFMHLIAVLRLAVPYTGLILTARESPAVRQRALELGVSQIDAGTRLELGGYTETCGAQVMEREQFQLGDDRTLDGVLRTLVVDGYTPSFCTACYRLGRTGEHFMEFAIPGFIKRFCTPNALLTLAEYLVDHAPPETQAAGAALIERELAQLDDPALKQAVVERLERIRHRDERDLYF
jgi:2-iminoacetate synthase